MKLNKILRIFLNEKFILLLIVLNALTIMFAAFQGYPEGINKLIIGADNTITILFLIELTVKIKEWGFSRYFASKWNIFDFSLILLSVPALISWILNLPLTGLSFFLIFRILRVFKSFRFIKFVPGMSELIKGVQRAIKTSFVIILGFSIYLFIIGILSCYLFRNIDPEHFENPLTSFYTIFRIFTLEGWTDIPGTISQNTNATIGFLTKLYFIFIVSTGGILGLSLVNSIFVEAMMSDNTDDIQKKVNDIDEKLDKLLKKDHDNKQQ